ncbi:hypothetical protein [Kitasatospora sp. NPDC101183]
MTTSPRATPAVVCLAGGLPPASLTSASLTGTSVALPRIATDLGAG